MEQQHRYLGTLRNEATRLTHLVENVLAYARLERGRTAGRIEPIGLAELIDGVKVRLGTHAEQSGMTLVVEAEGMEKHGAATVLANRSAVEQVLFNLVDNACKYAGAAADKRIHLGVGSHGRTAAISRGRSWPRPVGGGSAAVVPLVLEIGGGGGRQRPGIGLGLALSRRLARDMGGDLRLDEGAAGGARFVLSLPQA